MIDKYEICCKCYKIKKNLSTFFTFDRIQFYSNVTMNFIDSILYDVVGMGWVDTKTVILWWYVRGIINLNQKK